MREQKREIDAAVLKLEREQMFTDAKEKKLVVDIKLAAQANRTSECQNLAKALIRTRKQRAKRISYIGQLNGISMQLEDMASTHMVAASMQKVTRQMMSLSRAMKLPALQKITQEFQRESEAMGLKQEIMNDAVDDALQSEDDVAETDAVVNQVLDEIGISLKGELVDVPQSKVGAKAAAAAAKVQTSAPKVPTTVGASAASAAAAAAAGAVSVDADADLQARLDALKRDN